MPGHAIYRVESFKHVAPYTLRVRFDDGTERVIDFQPVLFGGLFGSLRDQAFFNQVRLDPEVHTLVWPNGADFDPANLHDWPSVVDELSARARKWELAEASMTSDLGPIWEQPAEARPGVSDEQVQAWEQKHGVRLPYALRHALRQQDGGRVRYSRLDAELDILPLAEIRPVEDEDWDFSNEFAAEFAEKRLVFGFGWLAGEGMYLLDYNARGPLTEPRVWLFYHDGGLNKDLGSVTELLEAELRVFDQPQVDWSETANLKVLANETIDSAHLRDGLPGKLEQILGRQDGRLFLFTRERTPERETLTKTYLPEPLVRTEKISRFRPAPGATHTLSLEPRHTDRVVIIESMRTDDGKWRNFVHHGGTYFDFEATDRGRLEKLRRALFGW